MRYTRFSVCAYDAHYFQTVFGIVVKIRAYKSDAFSYIAYCDARRAFDDLFGNQRRRSARKRVGDVFFVTAGYEKQIARRHQSRIYLDAAYRYVLVYARIRYFQSFAEFR
jgi:hypothetical protein